MNALGLVNVLRRRRNYLKRRLDHRASDPPDRMRRRRDVEELVAVCWAIEKLSEFFPTTADPNDLIYRLPLSSAPGGPVVGADGLVSAPADKGDREQQGGAR